MQFYTIDGFIADDAWVKANDSRETARKNARAFAAKTGMFNKALNKEAYFFMAEIDADFFSCGAIVKKPELFEANIMKFLQTLKIKVENVQWEEVTLDDIANGLCLSYRNSYIEDNDDDILYQFELSTVYGRFGSDINYDERILEGMSKDVMVDKVQKHLLKDTLLPEIDRIYSNQHKSRAFGHPVHYLIQTDNKGVREDICEILVNALYDNKRILNKRLSFSKLSYEDSFPVKCLDAAYKACSGGAFIIHYNCMEKDEGEFASSDVTNIRKICECASKYRNQVLTIISLPREATKTKERLSEQLLNMCFVELKEDYAKDAEAVDYLKMLAKESAVKPDKKLISKVQANQEYLSSDLRNMFDDWYDVKLRTTIYPQYKDLTSNRAKVQKEKPKGSAYTELMSMTGLSEAKKVIQQALDYYKAQKLFKEKGMRNDHPAMHMIFTGNPGSAKTTCARLFSEIMKENELLSKGHIVEVGRSDLVGKFVGHTAPIVKRKFEEAKGGVLFIDEAYSLVDDRDGLFGDEAINAIVQEMENKRDQLVVIFAGYPDKMEAFLDKNPGLRSRIAFHVPFDDYNVSELCDIAEHIAKEKGLRFTKEAMEKLEDIFEVSSRQKDFGNGRLVRNIIEKARMAQASRLLQKDFDDVTKEDIATIAAEDVEVPKKDKESGQHRRIGFCA